MENEILNPDGNACGYAKFETEIPLFVACIKKTKKYVLRAVSYNVHNLKQ
jgi:hypothetical protein